MPIRFFVTDSVTADCTKAEELIANTNARGLIADKGYDSDKIINFAQKLNMQVVIPPRTNRKILRDYVKISIKSDG